MLDVRPGDARPRVVRARGRSGRVDRDRARPRRPAVRGRRGARARRSARPGRRHLAYIMDELAIVEPHGADRLAHRVDAPALERAHRGHRPAARERRRRASACSSATAVCSSPSPTADQTAVGRAPRPAVTARSSSPTTNALRPLLERGGAAVAAQPAVFLRHRHPRPPDRRGDARASPASTRVRRGSCRSCSPRALPAALFTLGGAPALEHARPRSRLALVVGAWLAIVVDDPSETFAGIPTPSAFADRRPRPRARAARAALRRRAGAPGRRRADARGRGDVRRRARDRADRAPSRSAGRRDRPERRALRRDLARSVPARWAPTTACYALVVVAYLVALQHSEMETRRTWFQSRRAPAFADSSPAARSRACSSSRSRSRSARAFPARAARAWIQYRSLGSGSGSNILNVDLAARLGRRQAERQQSTDEVFTVAAPPSRRATTGGSSRSTSSRTTAGA